MRFDKRIDNHFIGANLTVFQTNIDDYNAEEYPASESKSYLIYNLGDVEMSKGFERQACLTAMRCLTASFRMRVQILKTKTQAAQSLVVMVVTLMGDSITLTLDYQSEALETIFGWNSMFVKDEDNVFDGQPIKEGYDVHNLYAQ
ncbi:hypothetical protein O9993_23200 [Vibrio lentus]|nr:hypothetical protein [Vibrio lentus]